MNLRALENLYRVYQVGSFSRAAEQANVTLSTLSMQMKTLEQELGVDLFDRTHRPPRLTPQGRKIAEQAQSVVEAQAALKEACSTAHGLAGHFRFGFIGSASLQVLPPFLIYAQQHWPNASFDFSSGLSETLCDKVREGMLDAAVVTQVQGAMEGLSSLHLFSEPMVLIHGEDDGDDFLSKPFLHFQPNSGIGVLIGGFIEEMKIRSRDSIHLDSIDAIIECVAQGAGFSLLPRHSVETGRRGDLVMRAVPDEKFFREVVLITPRNPRAQRWRDPIAGALQSILT